MRLDKNIISDFSSFVPIPTLIELYISENRLTLIAGVVNLFPNLEILDASRNQITDFEDVFVLNKLDLAELFLVGNPVTEKEGY